MKKSVCYWYRRGAGAFELRLRKKCDRLNTSSLQIGKSLNQMEICTLVSLFCNVVLRVLCEISSSMLSMRTRFSIDFCNPIQDVDNTDPRC